MVLRCPECNSRDLIKSGKITYVRKKPRQKIVERQRWLCYGCGLHTIIPKGLKK